MMYLHSTMYLLNLKNHKNENPALTFTFHYVSIKSEYTGVFYERFIYLHSTMYLLNRKAGQEKLRRMKIYIPLCIY